VITIQELLYNRGLSSDARIKMVRHKDVRFDLYSMYRNDKSSFLMYQSQQGRDVFGGVDFIVSFIGEEGTRSRFIGVFKVIGGRRLPTKQLSVDGGQFQFQYQLEEVSGFDDLKERVIIDWGKAAIKWEQLITNTKEVVEIQPGLNYRRFTDYFDFILGFDELQEIARNQYPDWRKMLSATKGVYLINDSKSGKLYVGSAYGEEGIWGRWMSYVSTGGHGGNKSLKDLVIRNSDYANNFKFSILMLLPSTITAAEAIQKEKLFKNKLGAISSGLNNN
jgi:hypothetical protein